jgi:ankyrin repeat protein
MVILLEFGADCNIQKNNGNTALHLASEKKSDIYICALLSHGANPNIINKTNLQTPLHIAIINKINEYVLNKFKENNGDIYNIKDIFNKTPFDYAQNDEKYKNLLISIFSEPNKCDYKNNKCLTEISNENKSNLDYNNFISLSRKIHLTNEDNTELNKENLNQNQEIEKNNIRDINNCLKKHLLFSSNSKEISYEDEKNKKSVHSEISKNSGIDQNDKKSQGCVNKNIINIISDKSSNFSNYTNKIIKNNANQNIDSNKENINNLNENDKDYSKKINLTSVKKENILIENDNTNLNYILSSPVEKNAFSHSLNLQKNNSPIKYSNLNTLQLKKKHIKIFNKFNTSNSIINNSNINGNNTISSYNKKREEGISEINPLDLINQMASSNNSNIFSELQINSNTKEEGENTNSKNAKTEKTEEEFFNEENIKLCSNDEINTMKDNISGNFSSNNNDIYNDNDNDKYNNEMFIKMIMKIKKMRIL